MPPKPPQKPSSELVIFVALPHTHATNENNVNWFKHTTLAKAPAWMTSVDSITHYDASTGQGDFTLESNGF